MQQTIYKSEILYITAQLTLVLLLACVLLPSFAYSAVVSWNKDVQGSIGPADTAGVISVANWNNSLPAEITVDLLNHFGGVTSLDINPVAPFDFSIQNSDPGLDQSGTSNKRLLNGYLNAGVTTTPVVSYVQISQIPYASYDLHAYFSSDIAGRTGSVILGGSSYDFMTVGAASLSGPNALFLEANSNSTHATPANYAVFRGLSGPTQALITDIPDFGGIAGFQIVERTANTVAFNVNAVGETKSVPNWGIDVAWPNFHNVRQSIENIGLNQVDSARVLVYFDEPLVNNGGNYELNAAAKAKVDDHLNLVAMAGTNLPLTFGTAGTFSDQIDASYLQGGGVNVTQYARAIKATQEYINSKAGFTSSPIIAIEAFNEPDYQLPYTNPTDLNSIIGQLKTYSEFQNTLMVAPSTLNSDLAQGWYDQVPQATAGSSHLLAGSLTSWTNFIDHVNNDGKPFVSMELHSMGEMLAGAERDMQIGMIWADVLRGRGTLIQASDGKRLGYAEDLGNQAAAAVYRAPNGQVIAFAGGLERDYTGSHTAFRFVSTDEDVYYNGIPVREYWLHAKPDEYQSAEDNDYINFGSASREGSYALIDEGTPSIPALDGYRWKIVNVQDGSVMESTGSSNGATIRSATDDGGVNQLWRITRTRDGYYHFYNANSGLAMETQNASLNDGANIQQWGTVDGSHKQWYIEQAGNGSFNIANAWSHKFLDADLGSTNIIQWEGHGNLNQQWQFVLANPTHGPNANYLFNGNSLDSAGASHGTPTGSPTYGPGRVGAFDSAIQLDGVDDFVQLSSGIADTEDITIATWVKWDGGAGWQRIFDFGNDTNEYMFLSPASPNGQMRFGITTDSFGEEYILETDQLVVGEWVHLTLTLGGNTGILYINGVAKVAGQILPDPSDFNPTNNFIGKSQWAADPLFNGSIADFRIFDYALDSQQVAELIAPQSLGDFNGDGQVDLADYTVWRDHFGTAESTLPFGSIATGNGIVDAEEYALWVANFGENYLIAASASAATNVPEPNGIALLMLGTIGLLFNVRQKLPYTGFTLSTKNLKSRSQI